MTNRPSALYVNKKKKIVNWIIFCNVDERQRWKIIRVKNLLEQFKIILSFILTLYSMGVCVHSDTKLVYDMLFWWWYVIHIWFLFTSWDLNNQMRMWARWRQQQWHHDDQCAIILIMGRSFMTLEYVSKFSIWILWYNLIKHYYPVGATYKEVWGTFNEWPKFILIMWFLEHSGAF